MSIKKLSVKKIKMIKGGGVVAGYACTLTQLINGKVQKCGN